MKSSIPDSATWEDMRTLLRNGTFPFDLNGLNDAGIQQQGMALSKANLLSDATATALGLSGDPTVDDAFGGVADMLGDVESALTLKGNANIQIGSYVGTGTYGASNPCSLTFDFVPQYCFVIDIFRGYHMFALIISGAAFACYWNGSGTSTNKNTLLIDGTTFTWYNTTGGMQQMNESGRAYYYYAIG